MHREKETTKKKKISASVTTTDRLTNLPESIIHHILSFIDTKSSVQTSLLSRSWRSLWKQVPVLDLNRSSSPDSSSFYNFVDNVLSLRNRDLNLRKVTYMNKGSDINAISDYTLKVSGPQLLTLKLKVYSSDLKKIEINAPKLQSLYALFKSGCLPEFTEVTLPSLVHATLHIDWFQRSDLENLVPVFGLVRYVKFLRLNFLFVAALEKGFDQFLQHRHSSSFIRLEKLIVEIPISYQLSNYFFKASRSQVVLIG
ncbi:Putative FBD-associated F-box protein At5g22720 [Linum perenne]